MLVIGDREVAEDGVSPRTHGGEDWKLMKVDAFIARVKDECRIPETELNP